MMAKNTGRGSRFATQHGRFARANRAGGHPIPDDLGRPALTLLAWGCVVAGIAILLAAYLP